MSDRLSRTSEYLYLHGDNVLPWLSREDVLSGTSIDGMCEVLPAEQAPDRVIWPGSVLYLKNGAVVGWPAAVCDSSFRFIEESLTLNYQPATPYYEKVYDNNYARDIVDLPGWWVCLLSWSNANYFHWFAQTVANLQIVNSLKIPFEFQYILPKLNAWQKESLVHAGVDLSRIKEIGEGIYRCEHLLYPSDLRNQPEAISSRMLSCMRTIAGNITAKYSPVDIFPKVYISRVDSLNRVITNEGELIDRLRIRGYRIVATALMDFVQEVLLFAHAKIIVGANGAGMTNMGFAPSGISVVELNPLKDLRLFEMMAIRNNQRYSAVNFSAPQVCIDKISPWKIDDIDAVMAHLADVEREADL